VVEKDDLRVEQKFVAQVGSGHRFLKAPSPPTPLPLRQLRGGGKA
jgi:hypothetical protein